MLDTSEKRVYHMFMSKWYALVISRVCFVATLLAITVVFPACARSRVSDHGGKQAVAQGMDVGTLPAEEEPSMDLSDPGNFFSLDYREQRAEGAEEAGKVELITPAIKGKGGKKGKADTSRSLDAYMTKYSDKVPTAASSGTGVSSGYSGTGDKAVDNKKPFTIIDWGPQGAIPAQVRFPSLYVLFSEPVVPLAALGEPADKSPYMTITPALKGTFRWKGTSLLTFDSAEPADPMVQYTITVASTTKSVAGKDLTGERTFTTQAARLDVKWLSLGKPDAVANEPRYAYMLSIDSNDAPIEAAHTIRLCFNYAVDAETIAGLTEITTGGEPFVPPSANGHEAALDDIMDGMDEPKPLKSYEFTAAQEKIDVVTLEVKEDFPRDTTVTIKIRQPNSDKDDDTITRNFHTLCPLNFVSYSSDYGRGGKSNPVRVVFNHPLDEKTVVGALSTHNFRWEVDGEYCMGDDMPVTRDNVDVSGNSITVFGLPVIAHSRYVLAVSEALKDVWGQPLSMPQDLKVEVPGMPPQARFAEGGAKMLEAQFPHRLIFEYQNANPLSRYRLAATDTPLSPYDWNNRLPDNALDNDDSAVTLDTEERDKRILHVVELDKYLTNGKGSVRFDAAIKLPKEVTRWDDRKEWVATNTTTVQVTNLGITARFGVNRVAALVSELSTGKPVEGATVNVYHKTAHHQVGVSEVVGTATTDSTGLAVIEINPEAARELYRDDADDKTDDAWYGSVIVEALTTEGDTVTDRAIFVPDSHSSWRDGVDAASIKDAYSTKPRIFMFSDRGLYKPGETISFRGIDHDQKLGAFIAHRGHYRVELKGASWRDDKVYATVTGDMSEEGGFDGSFKVDDDITPGNYALVYTRMKDIPAEKAEDNKESKAIVDGSDAEEIASQVTQEGGGSGASPRSIERNDGAEVAFQEATQSVPVTVSFFERLRFQCGIDMPALPVISGSKIGATLTASYLAGGVLAGANVTSRWYREPWYFTSSAPEFKGYRFGPIISGSRQIVTDGEDTLDTAGELSLSCETTGEALAGVPYRYRVSCDVMDESNQSISTAGVTVVHPASCYLGVAGPSGVATFPKAGDQLNFDYKWAALDGSVMTGAASVLSEGKKITVTLLRDEWNVVKQQGVSGYIYNRYEKKQVEESTSTVDAADSGQVTVTAQKPGSHTLRLATTDAAGRAIVTETTFYATGSGRVSWYSDDATAIRLTPNKARYTPGETATLLLESPLPSGDYLITVEREGIFSQEVRHFDGNVATIDVKVARNFLPVAYVSVSSYSVRTGEPKHQYGEVDLDKPKGYYGVAPIFVDPRVKSFTVKVASGRTFRPGEEAEVTLVATRGGRPIANAELTLMAVDRGVLDLIDYHVDDPISFFYNSGNFPLRVFGGDSRAMLMDPVTYAVNNLAGGDALMAKSAAMDKLGERADFNPTAAFVPVVKTDEQGRATVKFKLPDTLTTYRVTAFGVKGELLALQEDEIAVQNPINVQQVLPRRVRERDTANLGVLVTNLDSEDREVSVSLDFNTDSIAAAGGVAERAGQAAVDGIASKKATVASGTSEMITFDAAAVKAGAVNAVFTINSDVLNERLVAPLTIERPYIYETVTTTGSVIEADGKVGSATEQVVIPAMADDGKGSLTLTLDATRLGLLGGAVQYLFDYPFGCMEQQASRLLPLVTFGDYIDVFGLNSEVKDIKECVTSIFKGWKQNQQPNGGFGYWPDARKPDLYVSTRIAHVAALALERGYTKEDLGIDVDRLVEYVSKARKEIDIGDYSTAYTLYVLSLFGRKADTAEMQRLCKGESTGISVLSFCGMAAVKSGDGAFAAECARRIRSFIRPTAQGADLTDPQGNSPNYWCFYDGNSERLALAMQLFTMLDSNDDMVGRLLFSLMSAQRCGYWQSTAQTARVLDAFYTLIKAQNIDATDLTATATLGGGASGTPAKLLEGAFKGAAAKPVTTVEDFGGDALKGMARDKMLPLKVERSGTGNLYYTASLRYALPYEHQIPRDEGLCVSAAIYDNNTNKEIKADKGSTLVTLESGRTYRMVIDLSTTYDRAFVAIRAPIPSGAEILDATFVTTSDEATMERPRSDADKERGDYEGTYYGGYHWLTQRVIRDNEVQFFYDRFGRGRDSVEFVFRATRSGVYPTPPATAECMYEPEVFGRTGGTLFVVK